MVSRAGRRLPPHFWAGSSLVAVFWALNWSLEGLRTHWGFFPLWLGYCLAVDGLAVAFHGTSLLRRGRARYVSLFAISAPMWWLFEAINLRTRNWEYLGREAFGDVEYGVLASIAFSTVVPAVLGTAELAAGFPFVRRLEGGPALGATPRLAPRLAAGGFAGLALLLARPREFFPLAWIAPWLLVEAWNLHRGNRSLFDWLRRGEWRPAAALGIGGIVCGFFWELWNVFSYPKWVYHVPPFEFWHVFEMPLAGYLGYPPFALVVFAAVHAVLGRPGRGATDYVGAGLEAGYRRGGPAGEAAGGRARPAR